MDLTKFIPAPIKVYAGLAVAGVLVSGAAGSWAYVAHLQNDALRAKVAAFASAAQATVATGQTAAQADATAIADRGAQRAARLDATHEDHAHALQAAPGAGQILDPGFVRSLNQRLCEYDAYAADPGCAGLRVRDPGQLPQAGPADPPH